MFWRLNIKLWCERGESMLMLVMMLLSLFEANILSTNARLNDEFRLSQALKQSVVQHQVK